MRLATSRPKVMDDRGSVTIEAALSLAVLVTVAAAIIAGISTMAAYVSAVDVAGAAARSHAIGVEYSPPRANIDVTISENAEMVTVTARVPAVVRDMHATAVYPVEVR